MINPITSSGVMAEPSEKLWKEIFETLGYLCDLYVNAEIKGVFDILMENGGLFSRGLILAHFRETTNVGEFETRPVYLSADYIMSAPISDDERQPLLDLLSSYDPTKEFIIGACSYPDAEDSTDYVEACHPGFNTSSVSYRKYKWPSPDGATEVATEKTKREAKRAKSKPKQKERQLEDELYDWLRLKGVPAERQVSTKKHRLDLWIPGKIMLELKAGRVTGDDVCQAIDYQSTYDKPILLVGKGLSTAASRGVEGFNKATGNDLLQFVTWSTVKTYLRGVLGLDV